MEDYVYLIEALISAYETTGDSSYLKQADLFMKTCIDKFWDNKDGGFYDSDEEVLGIRIKVIEDIPQPSANSFFIECFLLL